MSETEPIQVEEAPAPSGRRPAQQREGRPGRPADTARRPWYRVLLDTVRRGLRTVLLIDAGVALVAGVVSRLIGWRTLAEYAVALEYGGHATIVLGAVLVLVNSGSAAPTRGTQFGTRPDIYHNHLLRARSQSLEYLLLGALAALSLYGISALLARVVGA
jgi:hypothetical protein